MHSKDSSEYPEKNPIPERVIGKEQGFRDIYHRQALAMLKTRMVAWVFAITTVIFCAGMVYYMTRVHDRVIAVQIDKDSGATIGVTQLRASLNAQVPDKAMEYFLVTEVITKLRTIPIDKTQYLKSIESTYAFMTPASKQKFADFIKQTKTAEILDSNSKSINTVVKSFNKVPDSKDTYSIRWQETTYDGNKTESTDNYVALVTVTIKETTEADYRRNPFGIIIKDVSVSKENIN